MHKLVLLSASTLALPLCAQVGETPAGVPGGNNPAAAAAYQSYGKGCSGSGWSYGADTVVPKAFATAFGDRNNNIPFSWSPCRYQQVFAGADAKGPVAFVGMGIRQDNGFANRSAHSVELEIAFGSTTFDHTTITPNFASNQNGSVKMSTVFKRRKYAMPHMPPSKPTDPKVFFLTIPFDGPWVNQLGTNDNLLIEVKNYGNSNNNRLFTYPLDAASGSTTSRVYGLGSPTATTGNITRGYGHMFALKPLGSSTAPPLSIHHSNLPKLGTQFHFQLLNAKANAAALLIVGASDKMTNGLPLPFDLTAVGAPGCLLLASVSEVVLGVQTGPAGDIATTFPIPANPALDGQNVYIQFAVTDTKNSLGLVSSNGGKLTLGN